MDRRREAGTLAPKKTNQPPPTPPSVSHEQGLTLVRQLIDKANTLLNSKQLKSDEVNAWETLAEHYLVKTFGSDSPNVSAVIHETSVFSIPYEADEHYWDRYYKERMQKRTKILESLVEVLETEIQLSQGLAPRASHNIGEKVFIVHGHNDGALQSIARFIEKLGLDKIILQEQPNRGRTIIEKFEDECKDVGFAIILMTADDRGGLRGQSFESQKPRARQNVVLELGFFLGRLGRNRVAVVYEEGVEIPSDYSGVLFTKMDGSGDWRLHVAREIKAAGFAVDMNSAL